MSTKHPTKEERKDYANTIKKCLVCGKEFTDSWSKYTLSKFCSRTCSSKYSSSVNRNNTNKIISERMTGKKYVDGKWADIKQLYFLNPKKCPICSNVISFERRRYKTCSNKCAKEMAARQYRGNPSGKMGGNRDRGGRSKSGYYKGYFCGSTYELIYTIYNIDHNIHFERNKKGFPYEYNGKTHNYYPDYITADGYVEIKGYWTDLVDIKLAAVKEPIKILYKKDLQYAFDYVSKTYLNGKKSNYQSLYDFS